MAIRYVTGADARFFNILLPLLEGFRRRFPDDRLWVCDFGLSAGQRRFLESQGQLLAYPPGLPADLHPWAKKAAVVDFLPPGCADPVCWFDADLIPVALGPADLDGLFGRLVAEDRDISIADDINRTKLADILKLPGTEPFGRLLAERGVPLDRRYINVGFWLCRSGELLRRWRDLALALPVHSMFEQNALACLLHGGGPDGGRGLILDSAVWQPHGTALAHVKGADGDFTLGGRRVMALHCTGDHAAIDGRLDLGAVSLTGHFRLFRQQKLRDWQATLLHDFVIAHRGEMAAAGLIG